MRRARFPVPVERQGITEEFIEEWARRLTLTHPTFNEFRVLLNELFKEAGVKIKDVEQ